MLFRSFDLATASCLLSHLRDYRRGLREIRRVLVQDASFAASCWGPVFDPYATAWREMLDGAVGEGAAGRAAEAVVPWEDHFSRPDNLRTALLDAGFSTIRVEEVVLSCDHSVEEYVADRALGAGGRCGHGALGQAGWRAFLERAEAELRRRFGDRVLYERSVVLVVGTVA